MFKLLSYTFITILGVYMSFLGLKSICLLLLYMYKGQKIRGKITNLVNIDKSGYIIPTICPVFEYHYLGKKTTGMPINFIGAREIFYSIGQEYDLYIIETKGKKFAVKNYREVIVGLIVFLAGIFFLTSWLTLND